MVEYASTYAVSAAPTHATVTVSLSSARRHREIRGGACARTGICKDARIVHEEALSKLEHEPINLLCLARQAESTQELAATVHTQAPSYVSRMICLCRHLASAVVAGGAHRSAGKKLSPVKSIWST
jgi:hypothetical protein